MQTRVLQWSGGWVGFAQDVEEVRYSVAHVDLVKDLPVGGDVLQSDVAVDALRVPDDVTESTPALGGSERRQGEEEERPGTHRAPHLSHRFHVAVRCQRVAVPTQTRVLQRRVGEYGVELISLQHRRKVKVKLGYITVRSKA